MENQTTSYMLMLSGLSDLPSLQLPLFLVFLFIYLMTIGVNLLIVVQIFTDSCLQSPMYHFLGTLACLDISSSSVTTPRILFNLYTKISKISLQDCITQVFFFVVFAASEIFLLAVMSYDRYVAICRPLHYMQIMHWKFCFQLISGVFSFAILYSLVHTLLLLNLTFCSSYTLQSFFCDVPQLLRISCSDTFINVLVILFCGIFIGGGILALTFNPYIIIMNTIIKIQSRATRSKSFSTCSSHLIVVIIFYVSIYFNYFRPNFDYHFKGGRVASVFYTILTPLLNPIIYSLRNQELKTSMKRSLNKLLNIMKNKY
ncbi:hypothetical protein GDO86_017680 [Hymenochirus boettgeri]|uniref:Olfactory receptor n=1 Tax=Hymenochirus boettgeri TaxID=247094 RepID=A0A8T2IPH1_9PIPI|nr:hypothetical protein GDO86_020429 [Hymenochirus boettgeri]KAG8433487.1 hypothetical protein GDO86_017680 [Hymenochirus boettgeri]